MLRRPANLAAAVSLLLCVTTCVLWVRSYANAGTPPSEVGRGQFMFINRRGQLMVVHHKNSPEPHGATQRERIGSLRGTWGTTTA